MGQQLLFLVNKSPDGDCWIRSPEERVFQQKVCSNLLFLITSYLKRTLGIEGIIYFIDHRNYTHQRYLDLVKPETILVNFCSGSELDGLVGPALGLFLEKKKIPYVGPSPGFVINTTDKQKLRHILNEAQIPIRPYQIVRTLEIPVLQYPITLNPADSYIQNVNIIQTEQDLDKALATLEQSFSLLVIEQYEGHTMYRVFVQGRESYCDLEAPDDVINLARLAYSKLRGRGLAIVDVSQYETGIFIHDVRIAGAYEDFQQKFGLDKTLQVINKLLL
jgi:hypothetical protein